MTHPGVGYSQATIPRGRDRLALFVATLGRSQASYVEFVTDERLETLLG